ncbi:UNVERIFIED_ORG: hypothetical protein LHK14_13230 [Roseateles sp. XES5]|nr:hypothetical protein [Roseateles sp. XES5]
MSASNQPAMMITKAIDECDFAASFAEAIFMAAVGINDTEQTGAIQVVAEEVRRKLFSISATLADISRALK